MIEIETLFIMLLDIIKLGMFAILLSASLGILILIVKVVMNSHLSLFVQGRRIQIFLTGKDYNTQYYLIVSSQIKKLRKEGNIESIVVPRGYYGKMLICSKGGNNRYTQHANTTIEADTQSLVEFVISNNDKKQD
jgi:hypothetical protein